MKNEISQKLRLYEGAEKIVFEREHGIRPTHFKGPLADSAQTRTMAFGDQACTIRSAKYEDWN